jgi:hypothetical protein
MGREIEPHCFSFYGLESIVIPQSVEQLGESCFSGCSGLIKVELPRQANSELRVPDVSASIDLHSEKHRGD